MFKLASFTDEISHDLAHACTVFDEFGVTGIEIRGIWKINVADFTDAQVRVVKSICDGYGMTVCSIGSPFGKCELTDPNAVAKHMDVLRRCADIGWALGCPLVRGFVFWGHGSADKPWDAMLKAYEPVPAILEEKDVILGIENEPACYVGTAGHLRMFLDRLGCDRAKAVWDPANHVQDPEGTAVPVCPDAYSLIKDDIVHVHVKDAAPMPDGTVPNVFMGEGICGWETQFQALKDDGYEGYVSLETHVDPEGIPKALRSRYGHYLTGEGREGASKVCLAWIQDTVARLA